MQPFNILKRETVVHLDSHFVDKGFKRVQYAKILSCMNF